MTRRTLPVEGKRQRLPAGLRTQFFLAHVVRPAAAALPDAAAEDQHIDQAAIVHIEVEPVVQTGADDDHRTAVGLIGVIGELARGTDNMRPGNAGDFLRPCRGIRFHVIIAAGAVFIAQTAIQTVVGHGQIVHGSDQHARAVGFLQAFDRQFVQQHVFQFDFIKVLGTFAAKIGEADVGDIVMATQQAQAQFDIFAGFTVALFKVPFAFIAPAEADRTVRYGDFALLIKSDGFPFRILFLT